MIAHIQRIEQPCGVIRGWHDPRMGYGDPYDFAATAVWLDAESIEVMGLVAKFTPELSRAIKQAAADCGVSRILRRRIRGGVETLSLSRTGLK